MEAHPRKHNPNNLDGPKPDEEHIGSLRLEGGDPGVFTNTIHATMTENTDVNVNGTLRINGATVDDVMDSRVTTRMTAWETAMQEGLMWNLQEEIQRQLEEKIERQIQEGNERRMMETHRSV